MKTLATKCSGLTAALKMHGLSDAIQSALTAAAKVITSDAAFRTSDAAVRTSAAAVRTSDAALRTSAAAVRTSDSLFLVHWQFLLGLMTHMRLWICCFTKRSICNCGCKGRCTFNIVFEAIAWSMRALLIGRYPSHGPGGSKLTGWREKLAGSHLRIRGAMIRKFGDWQWHKQALNMVGWEAAGILKRVCAFDVLMHERLLCRACELGLCVVGPSAFIFRTASPDVVCRAEQKLLFRGYPKMEPQTKASSLRQFDR